MAHNKRKRVLFLLLCGIACALGVTMLCALRRSQMKTDDSTRKVVAEGDWGALVSGLCCCIRAERPLVQMSPFGELYNVCLQVEFRNASSERFRVTVGGSSHYPPLFSIMVVSREGKEIADMEAAWGDSSWRSELTLDPGQSVCQRLQVRLIYADVIEWQKQGALLKLRVWSYPAPGYWSGQIISGGIGFPSPRE